MKILVTGAAGFIGSHLCDALIADGHEVWGVDNLQAGKWENLQKVSNNSRFTFMPCDITCRSFLDNAPLGIEAIFHLAASTKNICLKDPKRDLDTNNYSIF